MEKSPPASYPPMGIGASFWWWDALPHQPVRIWGKTGIWKPLQWWLNFLLRTYEINCFLCCCSKFPMVSYYHPTRRLCVGTKAGTLMFFDLKQVKTQTMAAHTGTVSAVAFSQDGKILASFSFVDNKMHLWQVREFLKILICLLSSLFIQFFTNRLNCNKASQNMSHRHHLF